MRTVGIDLRARDEHKAVILDEAGRFVSAVFLFETTSASLKRLLEMAQENEVSDTRFQTNLLLGFLPQLDIV